ncbi:MAG: hypothetical protein O7C39_06280 [Bacteroidetes bacterium]|nr:hypothetical protein [Bacteroidota bacterium]
MRLLVGLLMAISLTVPAKAQEEGAPPSLRIFLDCRFFCDNQYIKEELPIVDFLNERTQADVHILHARQNTAGGGLRITLTFLGQRDYAALSDTLTYATRSDATPDDRRRALLHHLTIGLSRYLARAGLSEKLVISAVKPTSQDRPSNSIEDDPWNYWVFSIGGNGRMNGQETTKFTNRRANFSANRTTEELKVRINGNVSDSKSEFDAGDETIKSKTSSERLSAQIVKSIGGQWAVGANASVSTSSFQNTKLQMEFGPAIEYDFFPYSQSTRKFLTLQYNIKLSRRQYDELTIFALDEETILRHSLGVSLRLSQKWGSLTLSTNFNHMLTNFDRSLTDSYNLGIFGSANVRLFRGFSFNTFASYNRIRDQLDLPSDEATKDEILLRSVQLPTGYSYFVNFGFTYRFGSIFNNVVNPRMGGGGGQNFFF